MTAEAIHYHLARTYRSMSGMRSITYRPDKSKDQPWIGYYGGITGIHFSNLTQAQQYHAFAGDPLVIS